MMRPELCGSGRFLFRMGFKNYGIGMFLFR